jgi:hypothetical protein
MRIWWLLGKSIIKGLDLGKGKGKVGGDERRDLCL